MSDQLPPPQYQDGYVSPFAQTLAAMQAKAAAPQAPVYTPDQVQQNQFTNTALDSLGALTQLSGDRDADALGKQWSAESEKGRAPRITAQGVQNPLDGSFSYFPEVMAQKNADELQRTQLRDDAAHGAFQNQKNAQEARAEQQREHDQEMGIQRASLAGQRSDAAQSRNDQRQASIDAQRYVGEDRLSKEFLANTKNAREQAANADSLVQVAGSAPPGKLNPNDQAALVFMINHIMDPNSVVREGEYARTAAGQGLLRNAQLLAHKITTGGFLDQQTIGQLQALATQYKGIATDRIGKYAKDAVQTANDRGYDPVHVVGHQFMPPDITVVQGGAAPTAAPAPPVASVLPQSNPGPSAASPGVGPTGQGAPVMLPY